ncbi:dynein regulatory complex protein 1-like [Eucyclogobius newberryi]|uniref:dynein regulatory complex protein 1-like n=1 Tax=Eucyclogobius newberryi TaxID=166745 RepID=UPI003B5B4B0C
MEKATKETTQSSEELCDKEDTKENNGDSRRMESKNEEKLTSSQKFIKLKRDLNIMETNIQAAAEARQVQSRREMDKARKIRLELLEGHKLSSEDKIEEICKGWHSAKEMVIPQVVQAAHTHQQQLFDQLLKDKKKILDVIQQDLKARDDSFVADLKKQTEELELMLERMEEQDKVLTKAYREELEQWKENVQKEEQAKRTEEQSVWEKRMKNLLDTEIDKLLKRQQAVEEYNAQIHHLMFEASENFNIIRNKEVADFQTQELEIHQVESEKIFMEQKIEKLKADNAKLKAVHAQMKAKASSLKSELAKLRVNKQTGKGKEKQLMEKQLKELNRKAQDYERLQKKRLHFAVAGAVQFENMWLMEEAEVKELLERALYVDSTIYQQVLRVPWERPNLSVAKAGRGREERRAVSWTSQESVYNESESEAELGCAAGERSGAATPRTVKRLVEILCDEAGFLLEVKIVKLLDTLDGNERTPIKMGYLFNTLGIKEKDVPKLVDFLFKYGQQCSKEREDAAAPEPSCSTDEVETSSVAPVILDPIDPNDVLQALKCFLDRYKQGRVKWSVQSLEAWDTSKDKAYWESLGNAITADRLKIWETTEKKLEQHHTVLCDVSKLHQEIQSLQQESSELQMVHMLLQQVVMDQSFSPDVTQLDMD